MTRWLSRAPGLVAVAVMMLALSAGASAQTPPPSGPIRVGGDIKEPMMIGEKIKPIYPRLAIEAGVQGIVYIEAIIAKDGSVKDATVVRGPQLLREAALVAVRQWKYSPTLLGNVPVEVVFTVNVIFTLPAAASAQTPATQEAQLQAQIAQQPGAIAPLLDLAKLYSGVPVEVVFTVNIIFRLGG